MDGIRIQPIVGRRYKNRGGGEYVVRGFLRINRYDMQNVSTGWRFTAVNITQYADGSIEWDYSLNGRFEEVCK